MSPFNASVDRVIDGDTVWVRVRLRLRSSTPPASTEEGKAATTALARALPRGTDLIIDPIVTDQFGRIVGTFTKV